MVGRGPARRGGPGSAYPDEDQRVHATRWLAWIACQAGDSRDLPWWEIPTWVSHWKLHLARGLSLGLLAGAVAALAAGRVVGLVNGHASSAVTVIIVGLVTGSGAVVVSELGSGLSSPPRTVLPRLLSGRDLRRVLGGGLRRAVPAGVGVGAIVAVAAGLASGSPARSAPGFLLGFGIRHHLRPASSALTAPTSAQAPSPGS
jgi:hypothetical protein